MEPNNMINSNKIKVLAIHGFAQSGPIFKTRISAFEKSLKKKKEISVDVLYPQGPFKVPPPGAQAPQDIEYFGWLTMKNWEEEFAKEEATFEGFQDSFDKVLEPLLKEHNDINVILGFSQGALLATMLQAHVIASKKQDLLKNLKCVILAAGVGSPIPNNYPELEQFYKTHTKSINIPSMHIMGETDEFIPVWRSEKLRNWYKNDEKILLTEKHEGKHCLPQNAAWNKKYLAFIQESIALNNNDFVANNQ